ncbi:MAG: InlB B-repeat-containing protein, partial [Fibrobacter sp.]|nr:InlB B-repeat-containing protein [Fibrobacter sp.]
MKTGKILSMLLILCILFSLFSSTVMAVGDETVTLLDITDAIAPINGGAPATTIAETDQYTGTVAWSGDLAQFEQGQTYTATITLTAKSGYTFIGVTANTFSVSSAMASTNEADSGVITATFVSPPDGYTEDGNGYITDGNGVMAYRYVNHYLGVSAFDIMGFYYSGWKQTTCGDQGYVTSYKIGDSETVSIDATGEPQAMGLSGLTLDIDFDFVSQGRALQVLYTVHNTGSENVNFSFGSHADTQIGSTDWAPISIFDPTLATASLDRGFRMVSTSNYDVDTQGNYAQFNFFGRRSAGVTDVDSFWYGMYWESAYNVFTQVEDTSYSGDSGMAYSWQNRTIGAGETQTYRVIIGIGGAESADVLGYSVAYDDNIADSIISVPETQQKLENIALTLSEDIPVRSGYEFDSWNTQADGSGTMYLPGDVFTPNASLVLYAQWIETPLYVNVSSMVSGPVYVGDVVTLTADVSEDTASRLNVAGNITITGVNNSLQSYSYQWYSNTTNSTANGQMISGANGATYQPPTSVIGTTYYYCAVNGFLSNVIALAVESAPPVTYTITATAAANGSISPNGASTVNSGDGQLYTITANEGYSIADVLVDGVSVGAVSNYRFSNV